MRRLFLLLACSLAAGSGWSIDTDEAFDDPALNDRYRAMIREVRCVKCQNQNIADSNAPIASDLRREIRRLMDEGATDQEITDFLVARYGDFVLYRPPLKPTTWVLWGAPFLLLAGGTVVFARVLKARLAQPIEDDDEESGEGADAGEDRL
jgi:cytochrome c-type biogenesis protein CcmH